MPTIAPRSVTPRAIALRTIPLLLTLLPALIPWHGAQAASCPALGQWLRPADPGRTLSQRDMLASVLDRRVILLGEEHDDTQHHAWQLHVLAALHAQRPNMVIGFEGFPRRVQPVLDRWLAGELTEAEFLHAVDWDHIWGLDAQLYLPIFHFARMHGVALVALNVDRTLVNRVSRLGWAAVPAGEREGVGNPEPAPRAYLEALLPAYLSHGTATPAAGLDDPEFLRFVDGMLLWDRAMAEALASAAKRAPDRLVVGIVGRGHAEHAHGIPRQLRALGIADSAVLLPWNLDTPCAAPPADIADGVFGMRAKFMQPPSPPRLGVELAPVEQGRGAAVHRVLEGSVAAAAGLRAGDIIEQAAGAAIADVKSMIATVRRQAPGTWLPLKVRRDGNVQEVVAKFPVAP